MTVTIATPEQIDAQNWRVTWTSDVEDPTYYVRRDGELIATTSQTAMFFFVESGESLSLEVLDDADEVAAAGYPGRITLTWGDVAATDHYRVEEYVAAAWTLRTTVTDDGSKYFTWNSRYLEDCTTHQFRIIPVGTNGNQGTALTLTVLMVRHPDVPDVTYSYDSGDAKVTIAAA